MTRKRNYLIHPKIIRDKLHSAIDLSKSIHELENQLIVLLKEIDKNRFYVKFGYNSLRGFCERDLNFTRTQSQRLATLVRQVDSSNQNLNILNTDQLLASSILEFKPETEPESAHETNKKLW